MAVFISAAFRNDPKRKESAISGDIFYIIAIVQLPIEEQRHGQSLCSITVSTVESVLCLACAH